MTNHIYCIGGANIDCKLKSSVPLSQKTSNPVTSSTAYGGVARNVAENLARWTSNIHLQCIVGNDNEGRQLLAHVRRAGVNIETCLALDHRKTSQYYAILDRNGEVHMALADMEIYHHIPLYPFTHSWQEWLEDSLIFVDANLPVNILCRAIQIAAQKNLKICIDPVSAIKAKALPAQLEHVYLIKPDLLEAAAMTGMPIHSINDCIRAGKLLLERGVKNVVISLGKSGYVIVNQEVEEYIETMVFSEIVDATGAGDAFIAGILLGLQQGLTIVKCCQMGAAAAAYTIQSSKTVAEDITLSRLQAYVHNQSIIKEHTNATIL